jgi:hypothetical protein
MRDHDQGDEHCYEEQAPSDTKQGLSARRIAGSATQPRAHRCWSGGLSDENRQRIVDVRA